MLLQVSEYLKTTSLLFGVIQIIDNIMRIIASFIIMALLPFFIPQEEVEDKFLTPDSKYCNARFDFCTEYPDTLLPHKLTSENNDGVTLLTKDKKITVTVSGMRKVFNKDIEALFDDFVIDRIENMEDGKIFYEVFEDNFYKTSFTDGKYHYFQKVFAQNNKYIIYQIKAPSTMAFRISKIKTHLNISLNT